MLSTGWNLDDPGGLKQLSTSHSPPSVLPTQHLISAFMNSANPDLHAYKWVQSTIFGSKIWRFFCLKWALGVAKLHSSQSSSTFLYLRGVLLSSFFSRATIGTTAHALFVAPSTEMMIGIWPLTGWELRPYLVCHLCSMTLLPIIWLAFGSTTGCLNHAEVK